MDSKLLQPSRPLPRVRGPPPGRPLRRHLCPGAWAEASWPSTGWDGLSGQPLWRPERDSTGWPWASLRPSGSTSSAWSTGASPVLPRGGPGSDCSALLWLPVTDAHQKAASRLLLPARRRLCSSGHTGDRSHPLVQAPAQAPGPALRLRSADSGKARRGPAAAGAPTPSAGVLAWTPAPQQGGKSEQCAGDAIPRGPGGGARVETGKGRGDKRGVFVSLSSRGHAHRPPGEPGGRGAPRQGTGRLATAPLSPLRTAPGHQGSALPRRRAAPGAAPSAGRRQVCPVSGTQMASGPGHPPW